MQCFASATAPSFSGAPYASESRFCAAGLHVIDVFEGLLEHHTPLMFELTFCHPIRNPSNKNPWLMGFTGY